MNTGSVSCPWPDGKKNQFADPFSEEEGGRNSRRLLLSVTTDQILSIGESQREAFASLFTHLMLLIPAALSQTHVKKEKKSIRVTPSLSLPLFPSSPSHEWVMKTASFMPWLSASWSTDWLTSQGNDSMCMCNPLFPYSGYRIFANHSPSPYLFAFWEWVWRDAKANDVRGRGETWCEAQFAS